LLGDSAGTTNDLALLHILNKSPGDREHIDARILEKRLVLRGNHGVYEVGWQLVVSHDEAPASQGVDDLIE